MQEQKEETEEVLENLESLEKRKRIRKTLVVGIISVLLIIIVFLGFSFYLYFQSPEKTLGLGANIESVLISQDGEYAYIKLAGGSLDKNITKIKFLFYDLDGKEFVYETSEGAQELKVPFKRSFWDWLFGRQFTGIYDYEINSNETGLDSFDNINQIDVLFEYQTETGDVIETPVLDTGKPLPPTTTNRSTGGGGDGGGGTTTPPVTCTDECSQEEIYCLNNISYDCSLGADGCLDLIETSCGINQTCVNGTGCIEIIECSSDENCSYMNHECSYGICNLTTNNCEIKYNTTKICRESSGECDVAEGCAEGLTICSNNLFADNGILCADEGVGCTDNACFNGTCKHEGNNSLCESFEYCDAVLDCQERTCTSCSDCELFWGINCNYNKCKNDCGDCYYDPVLGQEDCVELSGFCGSGGRINSCSDYYELECGDDVCDVGNCSWDGDSCVDAVVPVCGDGICTTGENCPADVGSCINNICYEPTCLNGCGQTDVSARENDIGCLLSEGKFCNGAGKCVECIDDSDCEVNETCISGSCFDDSAGCLIFGNIFIDNFNTQDCIESTADVLIQNGLVNPINIINGQIQEDASTEILMYFEDSVSGAGTRINNEVSEIDYGLTNGNIISVSGVFGNAFNFDNSSYISIPNYFTSANHWRRKGFTYSAWIYPRDVITTRLILGYRFSGYGGPGLYVRNGKLMASVYYNDSTGSVRYLTSTNNISANQWSYVALSFDTKTNILKLYLNGNLEASSTVNNIGASSTINSISVGTLIFGSGSRFDGYIDEVSITARPISDSEAKERYEKKNIYGSFESNTINTGGSYNTLYVEVNETNVGASQVLVNTGSGWRRISDNYPLIYSTPEYPAFSSFEYKVEFSANTSLDSIRFIWTNEDYSSGDVIFMMTSDSYSGLEGAVAAVTKDAFSKSDIDFMVATGDFENLGTIDKNYNSVYFKNNPLSIESAPWFIAAGNHNHESEARMEYIVKKIGPRLDNTLVEMRNYKEGPSPTVYGFVHNGTTYSFNYGNSHFIVLNNYYGSQPGTYRFPLACVWPEIYNWLEQDLQQNTKPSIFVFSHEGAWPIPGSNHYGDSLDDIACPNNYIPGSSSRPERERFWELLNEYNITAHFVGHSHSVSAILVKNISSFNVSGVYAVPYINNSQIIYRGEGVIEFDNGITGGRYHTVSVNGTRITFSSYEGSAPIYNLSREFYYELGNISLPVCGNNIKETGEMCDRTDLAGENCVSQGFESGSLGCSVDCLSFDTNECVGTPVCTNDTGCSAVGSFCDDNIPYTCSLGGDGCFDRINLSECGSGYYCEAGSCVEITGYEGFGAVTRGAEDCPYAGEYEVYHVTKLSDDGSVGTLRNAVSRRCRYIVFDVGGTITLQGDLNMPYSYITIDGSSAPAPGITILQQVGFGTMVEALSSIGPAHDIIIHHLRLDGQSGGFHAVEKDILGLDGEAAPVYNVILDHITGIESTDGIFDIWRRVYNVTISWNLMRGTVTAMHLATDSLGVNREDISFHHNVLYHDNERQINLDQGNHLNIDYVNNVIYGWGWMEDGSAGFKFTNLPGTRSRINIENNIYHYVPGPHNIDGDSEIGHPSENEAVQFFNGGRTAFITNGGEVYFNGNIFPAGEIDANSTSGRIPIPAYAEVTKYDASTLGDTVVPYVGTHYPTSEEQDILNEVSLAVGGGGVGSSSVFSALWSWIKGLLTTKTGNAILTGKTINGNAVNESGESKVPYIILSLLAGIILIIGVIILKIKRYKKFKR